MSERTIVECDECGRPIVPPGDRLTMMVRPHKDRVPMISIGTILEWGGGDQVHDVCGEECFHKHISKLLKLPAAPVEDKT